jgi:hypothetical protein
MNSNNFKTESGYIALITSIILSALLTLTVLSISSHLRLSQSSQIALGNKEQSYGLALSCQKIALKFAINHFNHPFPYDINFLTEGSCSILSINSNQEITNILTKAVVGDSATVLETKLLLENRFILSVHELSQPP